MDVLDIITFKYCGPSIMYEMRELISERLLVSPSKFIAELQMTTEERLHKIKTSEITTNRPPAGLNIVPNCVIFQNYTIGMVYSVPVSVINSGKNPCEIILFMEDSPYVKFIIDNPSPAKLAPGMEIKCTVQFSPQFSGDYIHYLQVISTELRFSIQIIAIGPRPMLTFPDNVVLDDSSVDIGTEKHLLVKNIGHVAGSFRTICGPNFSVKPEGGLIRPDTAITFIVRFCAKAEGHFKDYFNLRFDSGETLKIGVEARAKSSNVVLSKQTILFEDTYMGLKCHKTVKIHNNSDHVVRFAWKIFSSKELDHVESEKIKEGFEIIKDLESRKNTKLEQVEVIEKDTSRIIYDRIYQDELIDYDNSQQFLYTDAHFFITPLTGEIYPNHSIDVTLVFSPQLVKDLSSVAYCEATAKLDRIPLKLLGCGIGPKLKCNIDTLELNDIFLFAEVPFQVVFTNNGDIPSDLLFSPAQCFFDVQIKCVPESLCLKSFEHGAFTLYLKCNKAGYFVEDVQFLVKESGEIMKMSVNGHGVYARLLVEPVYIDFEIISIGIQEERELILHNVSSIDIPYKFNINQGTSSPIRLSKVTSITPRSMFPDAPNEFTIVPMQGICKANESIKILIQLIPNSLGNIETILWLETWSSVSHRIAIKTSRDCCIPKLICKPSNVNIRFSFLNYLCHRIINIRNDSNIPGYIWLYTDENVGLQVSTSTSEIFIDSFESIDVSMNIICTELGKQQATLKYCLFGGEEEIACSIECIGQGPVVELLPEILNFEFVNLLETATKPLSIFNDSPTEAEMEISVKNPKVWSVSQKALHLQPEETGQIEVSCYLNDTVKYLSVLACNVKNRGVLECRLMAKGVGSAIQITPKIAGVCELGPQLTKTVITKKFLLKNCGNRYHKIIASPQKVIKNFQNYNPSQVSSQFKFEPSVFSLKSLEEMELVLTTYNKKKEDVSETWYFHAIIEKIDLKQIIVETIITISFVDPSLSISKTVMNFRSDTSADKSTCINADMAQIVNNSPVPLDIDIIAKSPFFMTIHKQPTYKLTLRLEPEELYYLTVHFDSSSVQKSCFVVQHKLLIKFHDHPNKEFIHLYGEVNYPNVSFNPNQIDFVCTSTATSSSKFIELKNLSPLRFNYHFEWYGKYISVTDLSQLTPKQPTTPFVASLSGSSELSVSLPPIEQAVIRKNSKKGKGTKRDKSVTAEKKAEKKQKKRKESKEEAASSKKLPHENLFEHYYIEDPVQYSHVLIFQELHGLYSKDSLIGLTQRNVDNLQLIKKNLFAAVRDFTEKETNYDLLSCVTQVQEPAEMINQIVEVVPFCGVLEPFETQIITVTYAPRKFESFISKLICHIAGGPEEYLDITGTCANIHYELESTQIDFGRRMFNEISEKYLYLKNTGIKAFTITIKNRELDMSQSTRLLEVGWFEVHPKFQVVHPGELACIIVKYTPGISRKFVETFEIEIENLDTITVSVTGYGVYPQVYLSLPNPTICNADNTELCYHAIANLTDDFLAQVETIKDWNNPEGEFFPFDFPSTTRKQLRKAGWVIVTYNRKYPSKMDIDLAIERYLACRHIVKTCSQMLDNPAQLKSKNVPLFTTSPYILDMKCVVIENTAHYTIQVLNYGPTVSKIHVSRLINKSVFFKAGFNLQLNKKVIRMGDSEPLHILFYPTAERYTERETKVNVTIYLDVYCGPRIPIQIKALVTKPFILTNVTSLQFDNVTLGACKIMNLILKNGSQVPVIWEASIFHPKCLTKPNLNNNKLFFLNDYSGRIEPHETRVLDVTFEPTDSLYCDWRLKIAMDQSDEQIIVTLNGQGFTPQLKIDNKQLWFEPCRPYETNTVYFTIENPCSLPVEFYFPDFDKQILEEDVILSLLCQYYSSNKLYIPQRFPGEKLPYAFNEFVEDLRNELKQSLTAGFDESPNMLNSSSVKMKKMKKKKFVEISQSNKSISYSDPLMNKSSSEIVAMLKEYLKTKLELRMNESPSSEHNSKFLDPIEAAFLDSKGPNAFSDTPDNQEGTLIICHGAPYTEYLQAANRLARSLKLPIYSIDDFIVEALVHSGSLSCVKINEMINEAFEICKAAADMPTPGPAEENPLQWLKHKIHVIQNKESSRGSAKKGSKKNSPKASKSSKSAETKKIGFSNLTFLNIPQELLLDLLRHKFAKFRVGLVIESLHNTFMHLPILTLYMLLQASGAMKQVIGVFTYLSMQQYRQNLELRNREEHDKAEETKLEMLEHFDEISDSELDHLSPEFLNLYKKEYVALRKENTARRLENLRIKKITKQARSKAKKKGKTKSDITLYSNKSKKSIPVKVSKKGSEKTYSSKSPPKKHASVDKKQQLEESKMTKEFDAFTSFYLEAMHVFEFWDRRSGIVSKEYVPKKNILKAKNKSSEKASKKTAKSTKTSVCFTNFETILADPNIGIPLWLVNESSDVLRAYDVISSQLKNSIQYVFDEKTPVIIMDQEIFTIVSSPKARSIREPSSVFNLLNSFEQPLPWRPTFDAFQELDAVDSDTRYELYSISGKLSKKRRRKSRTKASLAPRTITNKLSTIEHEYLDTRSILEPGHVRHYKIKFQPKNTGHYESTYGVEITGANIAYQVRCSGNCDIPRIDMNPNALYSASVADKMLDNKFATNVFVKSTGVFDFGNILLCSGSVGNVNRYAKEAYIHLKNLSVLPCEVTIHFLERTNVFRACREMIIISPSHIETLILYACPEMLGNTNDVLALSMKHNPRVELIPLTCNGCVLTFEIAPKKIIFERVLLHTSIMKYFQLNNKSLITIHWQFTNIDDFHDQLFINPTNGILKPCSAIEIMVEYLSLICEIVTNKKLHLEVYREMAEDSPLLKDVIEISAETCDLILKCEKNIDFGEIKAKKEYSYNYVISNEGKYNALYEFTHVDYSSTEHPANQNIANMFKLSQTSGTLSHLKPTTLILRFSCNNIINIANFPIYICNILDDVTRKVIGVFFISVSMKTNYSKFKIYPLPDINFGPLLVGTQSTQKIIITNTGTLEFSYQILCKRTLDLLQAKAAKKSAANSKASLKTKSTKSSKKSSKAASKKSKKSQESKATKKSRESKEVDKASAQEKGSKKSKDKASKKSKASRKSTESKKGKGKKVVKLGPPISCGIFTVKNSKNTVQPGEKAEVEVICYPNSVEHLDETLVVFVSETRPKDRMGQFVQLKVIPCLPSLDFNNLESIFREHFIVHRLSNFEMPEGIGDHCVFITNTQTLQFNNVCLNTTASTNLQLYNNGLIDAEVTISCTSQNNVFTVPVKTLYILSYSHAAFCVEFSPTELEKYFGNLEIKIVMPAGFKEGEKSFALSGQGTVPEITLRIPEEQNNFNTSVVVLDPTLIGTYTTAPISFENTGLYPCKVIVEVFDDPKYAFNLNIMTDSLKFLHCPEAHATDHFKKIKFSPGDIANFELVFRPQETDNFMCTVKIHIINNPFEVFTLNIEAICFSEDIILLNLPMSTTHELLTVSISDISLSNLHGINYQLNLGLIYLNTLYKQRFKIVNKSEEFTYKFVFRSSLQDLKYIPSIGHLAPGTCKDIFVTYIAHAPANIAQNLLDCVICKINYTTPVEKQNDIPWDDRQRLLIVDENVQINENASEERDLTDGGLDKTHTTELNSEPEYEVVKDSITRILILFSAVANYSKYECSVTDIKLPETFIFEKQIFNFDVVNTGEVNLEIKWNIVMENYSSLDLTFIKKPCAVPYKRIRNSKARPLTGHEKFIGDNLVKYVSQSRQTIVSDTPLMPFKIEPTDFTIPPKTSKRMTLHFCPLEVYEYKAKLQSSVTNLSLELNEMMINIKAQSLAASCRFDAQFSDYITSGRRLTKTCDTCEINSSTKVVEFGCLGVGIKHDFSFNIINPEYEDIQYSWHQIKSYELSSLPLFSCLHEKGVVMAKKQFPATFSLFPHKTGLFEALYNFKIDKYNIDIPLLLVARVREAKVNFTSSNVYLKPTVLGIAVHDSVVLKNHEDVDIHFKIRKSSLYSEGRRQFVTVEPRDGCLKRNSETKIKINFNPTDIGDESFILKCRVDFAQRPLNLGITTKCHAVEVLVSCLIAGKKIVLTEDSGNILNLGEILPLHKEEIIFYVRNQGKIGFYYFWKYNDEFVDRKFDIKLNTLEGYVKMNSELAMILNITAMRNATLKNFRLELQVRYGPTYKILLNTAVAASTYKFSFLEFDFGPCFVQNSSICYYHKALEVYNQGENAIILELTFFNQEHLTVDFKMKTIPPKRKELISICFHPKKIQKYTNELIFSVNDKATKVVITGEGIVLNLGLVNIEDKSIDLGSPAVGKTVVKVVKVINKSLATVNAIFDIWNRLPIVVEPLPPNTHYLKPHKKEKIIEDRVETVTTEKKKKAKKAAKKKSDKSSSKKSKSTKNTASTKKSLKDKKKIKSTKSKASTKKKSRASRKSERKSTISFKTDIDAIQDDSPETKMISITPTKAVTIFPNKISEFIITYSPFQKIQPFTNKVSVQVLEMVQPLCIIKGSCLGPSFFLDREDIFFGAVVQYCSRSVKVMLYNEGDVSSRFHWECENKEDFSFTPVQGYSAAGIPTMIVMNYHPTHLNMQTRNISVVVMKLLRDGNKSAPISSVIIVELTGQLQAHLVLEAVKIPLSVNLTGFCANIPDPIATIRFECYVRTTATESVTIVNNSMQRWKLYPQLNSDCFTCTNMINISEKGNSVCEIVYSPLNMTKKEPHKATLFIKIPDGQALVYELEGKANRPEALKSLYLEVHCKTLHKEVFPVYNWSRSKQTFKVFTEDITTNSEDILYEISGQETLEVMGNNTKNYEWYFYPYKEGGVEVRVIFMNAEKEYIFYQVLIKVIKCKTLETINLSSCIRSSKTHKLLLINPLDYVITYKLTSNSPLLSFSNTVSVPSNSELDENIEFLPILCEETSTTLEASCVELGSYLYEFKLKGLPAILEPPIIIKIPLGKQKTVNVTLKNFTKLRAVFNNKIEYATSFIISKAVSVNLYQSINYPLTFFPHEVGEINTSLFCLSSTAGDYEFPIIATCTVPKPKGPFRLKPNSSILIEFTNPYLTEEVFNVFIEPQAFVLINNEETIKARSSIKILIKLIDVEKHCKVIGKLVVSSKNDSKIKWTFYLEQE